jgi:hypothetical protein
VPADLTATVTARLSAERKVELAEAQLDEHHITRPVVGRLALAIELALGAAELWRPNFTCGAQCEQRHPHNN